MNLENFLLNLDDNFMLQIHTTDGKIDLLIGVTSTVFAFLISQFIVKRYLKAKFSVNDFSGSNFFYYISMRSIFPITAIVFLLLNYLRFILFADKVSLVYPAMIWLALWVFIIQFITGIVLFIFPRGAIRYTLGSILSLLFWLAYLAWWTGINTTISSTLNSIKIKFGPIHFTMLALMEAAFIAIIILIVSIWLNKFLEIKISKTERFDDTYKHIILRIGKILIFIVVVLSILPILGIDMTTLSVFSGALGVGIGIGLQKFIGNIFSGIMILIDRSIKIGDRVIVGEHTGYVTKITSRHIILHGLDNSEILVPNEKFIFNTIINQSYTNTTIRTQFSINVSYDTDLTIALQLLKEAAKGNTALDPQYEPVSTIENFGTYAIGLSLSIWVKNPKEDLAISRTTIYLNIMNLLKQHNIKIPTIPFENIYSTNNKDST